MSKKGKHSIKTGTNNQGSSRFLPLGGRLGGCLRLLLTALLLLAGQRYAFAQPNNAGGPYLNSWHQYSVVMGDFNNNTYTWTIQDDLTSPGTIYNVDGSEAWVDITAGATNYINIKFINANFSAGQTWYLLYAEFSGAGCIARREFTINVSANLFYLDMDATVTGCNSYSGTVWDNTTENLATVSDNSTVNFTVTINKPADFLTDGFRFTGSVAITSGASYTLGATVIPNTNGTTANSDSWTITDYGDGTFLVEVSSTDASYLTDDLTFQVTIHGQITQDAVCELTISGGEALSGDASTYVVVTDDNGTGNYTTEQTVFGVPNTSRIAVVP